MRLLQLVPSLDPRGGGPMEALRQLSLQLHRQGHVVEVACLDVADAGFLRGYPLPVHALGPASFGYRYCKRLLPWLRAHAKNYDAVIVNGLWQHCGLAAWRALAGSDIPYYVYTHGMLDPWFKRRYPLKHLKKWLYWPWAEYRVLRDARAVIFTCSEERLLARQSFWLYRCTETIAALGTAPVSQQQASSGEHFLRAYPKLQGKRLLLFLGRIHEKKGCDLLIEAYARIAARDQQLCLVMGGPDHDGLSDRLRQRCTELGIADRVEWTGMLEGDLKWGAFMAAELFVLPSHQENFGIAVIEALACSTPVLISDKVNIWREIDADSAGIVGADTVQATADGLQQWLALPPASRLAMSDAAQRCFAQRFSIDIAARNLSQILQPDVVRI
jgi:glycosyltransferase involved in cell wall biosynthesis